MPEEKLLGYVDLGLTSCIIKNFGDPNHPDYYLQLGGWNEQTREVWKLPCPLLILPRPEHIFDLPEDINLGYSQLGVDGYRRLQIQDKNIDKQYLIRGKII